MPLEIGEWGDDGTDAGPFVACTHENLSIALRWLIVQERLAQADKGSILEKKAFADVMEECIETDPTLRQPFDAAVKYVQHGAAPNLHEHVDAYKELTENLIADLA